MSVFQVALNSVARSVPLVLNQNGTGEGTLDTNPLTGAVNVPSYQRTVYIMGPNRINRVLKDGDTFTDCNYYKKFDFINVLHDDGSTWNDATKSLIANIRTYQLGLGNLVAYINRATNSDSTTDTGGYAQECTIINNSSSLNYDIVINGTQTFTLAKGTSVVFDDMDDAKITSVAVVTTSGIETGIIQVIASVVGPINS